MKAEPQEYLTELTDGAKTTCAPIFLPMPDINPYFLQQRPRRLSDPRVVMSRQAQLWDL